MIIFSDLGPSRKPVHLLWLSKSGTWQVNHKRKLLLTCSEAAQVESNVEAISCTQPCKPALATAIDFKDISPMSESSKTGTQSGRKMSKALNPKTNVMGFVTCCDFYRIVL